MTPQFIIVHHSITPRDLNIASTEASINRNHKARGFSKSSLGWYIGYQHMIFGDGILKQYRKDTEEGAHCKEQNMNFQSIGICLIGDFDREEPSKEQIETLEKLMRALIQTWNIPAANIYPHRKFATYKSCYGKLLSDDWARNLILNEEPMNKQIAFTIEGSPTVYVPVYSAYIGVASMTALNDVAPNVLIKTLSKEEAAGMNIRMKSKIVDN